MRIEPEISGVGVVVLGNFNPAIFTPAWFALHGLLPKSVADNADMKVAHPQIAAFDADWLHLQVTVERFSADTPQAPHVRVRDLVVRVFRERLAHTPLTAFGINRHVHFQVRSRAERDRIGRMLAPAAPWGSCGKALGLDGEYGGMTSLTMSQTRPDGRPAGDRINITVEPSVRFPELGVYVNVNDHYTVDSAATGTAERLMASLEDRFDASLKRDEQVIDHVMSLATNRER